MMTALDKEYREVFPGSKDPTTLKKVFPGQIMRGETTKGGALEDQGRTPELVRDLSFEDRLGLLVDQTLPDPALSLVLFGQSFGKAVSVFLSRPVSLPVRRLRFRQPPLHLLPEVRERSVVIQGCVGLDLGAVQRHAPHFDQPGLLAEKKNLGKEVLKGRSMLLPKPGDGSVTRKKLGRDHPIGDIPHAQPLDLSARPLSLAIGVKKQRRHDSRIKTRTSPGILPQRVIEGRQIQCLHRLDQEIGDIILRQPIHHVRRKKKALGAMLRFVKIRHGIHPGKRCA